jgi:hypothetical protein
MTITSVSITIDAIPEQTYTGSEIKPAITVKHAVEGSTRTLAHDKDYTLLYSNNKNAGTATVTITGDGDYTGNRSVNFTIIKATPSITTLPTAASITEGASLSASALSGGTASTAGIFAWTSPADIPLIGTHSFSVTFTPTDTANYNTVTDTVSITVTQADGKPQITTTSLPNGNYYYFYSMSGAYEETLTATGDDIAWSIESGTLPTGLELSAAGVISGTPTNATAGRITTFTVRASNSTGSDTKQLSITIVWNAGSSSYMSDFLNSVPANTAANPYHIAIHQNAGLADMNFRNKYVILDCSGSTFNSITSSAFAYYGSYTLTFLVGIILPESVTSIGQTAFRNCTNLTSITIPDSVTSIGDGAFQGCTSLTSVTIGSGVTSIGVLGTFNNCTSLTSINVDPANSEYSSQDGVLYNKDKTVLVAYPAGKIGNTFIIPNNITSIESTAFRNCTFTNITIPNSVKSIGDNAFTYCSNLTSITIGSGVTSIGTGAFTYCTSLSSVTIPNNVISIGNSAFLRCTSLTSITFATGSNIPDANFGTTVSPEGSDGAGGNTLKTAYNEASPKAGTYTRVADGSTWTKQ